MKKILRAVAAAMMLATGAQAAVVDGPVVVGPVAPVTPDLPETFEFWTGPTTYSSYPDYNVFRLALTINGAEPRSFIANGDPQTMPFRFVWQFAPGAPRVFDISAVITSYKNASIVRTGGQAPQGNTLGIATNASTAFRSETITAAELTPSALRTSPTAVPLAGTLPLMLSALGLGALVMRRRAKRAAALA